MDAEETALEQHAYELARDHSLLLRQLVTIREAHDLTQGEVGLRMGGISQPAVARLERYDSNPTLATLRRYAFAVGADMETEVHCRFCANDHSRDVVDQFGWRRWPVVLQSLPMAPRYGSDLIFWTTDHAPGDEVVQTEPVHSRPTRFKLPWGRERRSVPRDRVDA